MAIIDSSVMDFWLAYDEKFPLNENRERWMQHAVMMTELKLLRATQTAAAGAQPEPFEFNDFLPERYHIEKPKQTAHDQEAALRKGLGL